MIIDEPMGEDCVRVLRFEDGLERLVMCVVDNRVAVDLIRICWLCLQNLTCLFRFGNAHSCRSLPQTTSRLFLKAAHVLLFARKDEEIYMANKLRLGSC